MFNEIRFKTLSFFHSKEPLTKRCSDGREDSCNHVLRHKSNKACYLNGTTGTEGIAETLTCRRSVCLSERAVLRGRQIKCLCSPWEKDRHMQYYQKGGNMEAT